MKPRTAATLALIKRIREAERDRTALEVKAHQYALDMLAARHASLIENVSAHDGSLEDGGATYRAVWLSSISQEIEHCRAQSDRAQTEKDRSTETLRTHMQEVTRLDRALDKAAEAKAEDDTRRGYEELIEGALLRGPGGGY